MLTIFIMNNLYVKPSVNPKLEIPKLKTLYVQNKNIEADIYGIKFSVPRFMGDSLIWILLDPIDNINIKTIKNKSNYFSILESIKLNIKELSLGYCYILFLNDNNKLIQILDKELSELDNTVLDINNENLEISSTIFKNLDDNILNKFFSSSNNKAKLNLKSYKNFAVPSIVKIQNEKETRYIYGYALDNNYVHIIDPRNPNNTVNGFYLDSLKYRVYMDKYDVIDFLR